MSGARRARKVESHEGSVSVGATRPAALPTQTGTEAGPSRFQGNSFRSLHISGLREVHAYVSQRDRRRIHNHKFFFFKFFFLVNVLERAEGQRTGQTGSSSDNPELSQAGTPRGRAVPGTQPWALLGRRLRAGWFSTALSYS